MSESPVKRPVGSFRTYERTAVIISFSRSVVMVYGPLGSRPPFLRPDGLPTPIRYASKGGFHAGTGLCERKDNAH